MPTSSVSSFLVWNQLLPLLGVDVKGSVLPAVVVCPLCNTKQCYVYQDTILEGQWHHCLHCGSTGDMIELASRVWKMNIRATLVKARECGLSVPAVALLESTVATYQKRRLGPRQSTRAFWTAAQKHFLAAGSSELRHLQWQLGIQRVDAAHTKFLGSIHVDDAERFINPPSMEGLGDCIRGKRCFKGKGWGDVLVVPFWDMPGRICGFLFAGRGVRKEHGDIIYQPVSQFRRKTRTIRAATTNESGLAMLDGTFHRTKQFGNTVFVLDDAMLALRLQLRWLKSNVDPLPVMATYGSPGCRTRRVWEWMPTENVIFWAPQMTHRLLSDARRANAKVSTLPATEKEMGLYMRHRPVQGWFKQIEKKQQPWEEILRRMLKRLPPHRIEELIVDMDFSGHDRRTFIAGCDQELQKSLATIYEGRPRSRQIAFLKQTIIEHGGRWTAGNGGAEITDFVIRIEQTLQARSGRTYYRGVILYQGEIIPFTEQTKTVDQQGLWPWCRSYVLAQGKGIPIFAPNWKRYALELTLKFHPTQIVKGIDVVGWDVERHQFNFPNFAIKSDGDVLTDYACLFTGPGVPGEQLSPPDALHRREVEVLSEQNDETKLFFAVLAAVVNNIIAVAINASPTGVILDGPGAQEIGQMAAIYLGCPETKDPVAGTREHQWPTLVHLDDAAVPLFQRWLATGHGQSIITVPHATARVLGIRNCWNIIRCDRKLGSMQLVNDIAGRVLPAYLQDLCSRRLWFEQRHEADIANILDDIAEWFLRGCGGNAHTVLAAHSMLELPGKGAAAKHFAELIYNLCEERKLSTVWADYGEGTPKKSIIHSSKQGVSWIPQRYVVDQIEHAAGITPDILLITKALEDAGALVKECEVDQQRGWLIHADWLSGQTKLLETQVIE